MNLTDIIGGYRKDFPPDVLINLDYLSHFPNLKKIKLTLTNTELINFYHTFVFVKKFDIQNYVYFFTFDKQFDLGSSLKINELKSYIQTNFPHIEII